MADGRLSDKYNIISVKSYMFQLGKLLENLIQLQVFITFVKGKNIHMYFYVHCSLFSCNMLS